MKRYLYSVVLLLCIVIIQACSAPPSEDAVPEPTLITPAPTLPAVPPPEAEPVLKAPYIAEIKDRYYSDVMLGLVSKSDYGEIYPYIGGFTYSPFTYNINYLFGIVDSRGRIICDPVYNSMSRIERPDGGLIYLFRKYKKSEDENYDVGGTFVFSALDGSWVRRFEQAHYEDNLAEPVIFDYIAVCSEGKWGAIDYDGNDILPCEYNSPPLFREGLAPVLTDDKNSYVYINSTGKTVLGPYPLPPSMEDMGFEKMLPLEKMYFNSGRALYFEAGKYGFIDKQGNIVIEPQFEERYRRLTYEDGFAVVRNSDEYYGVIDLDGNFVVPMEMTYILNQGGGVFLCDKGNESLIYDAAGNITPYEYSYEIGGGWSIAQTDAGDLIVRGNGTEHIFQNAHYASFLEGDKFIVNHTEPRYQSIENMSGKIFLQSSGGYTDWSVHDAVIFTYLPETSFSNPLQYGTFGILDFEGNIIIPQEFNYLEAVGENYLATKGAYGGLLNKRGDWIIKVSLLDYLND